METINETGQSLLFVDNNFPDGLKFEAETWVPSWRRRQHGSAR